MVKFKILLEIIVRLEKHQNKKIVRNCKTIDFGWVYLSEGLKSD
jgi:hypothetical protein